MEFYENVRDAGESAVTEDSEEPMTRQETRHGNTSARDVTSHDHL